MSEARELLTTLVDTCLPHVENSSKYRYAYLGFHSFKS